MWVPSSPGLCALPSEFDKSLADFEFCSSIESSETFLNLTPFAANAGDIMLSSVVVSEDVDIALDGGGPGGGVKFGKLACCPLLLSSK